MKDALLLVYLFVIRTNCERDLKILLYVIKQEITFKFFRKWTEPMIANILYLSFSKIIKLLVNFLIKNGATLYVPRCAATFLFLLSHTKKSIRQKTVVCAVYKTLVKHAVLRHCGIICCVL